MKLSTIKDDEFRYQYPPYEVFKQFSLKFETLLTSFASEAHIDQASIQVNKCLMAGILAS